MKVLKFGGSSVGSPERIKKVRKLIEAQPFPVVVVFSAFQGVTDELSLIGSMAASGLSGYRDHLEKLIIGHNDFLRSLLPEISMRNDALEELSAVTLELRNTIDLIASARKASKSSTDQVLAFGERMSSLIISKLFPDCNYIDSREIIKTDNRNNSIVVDFETTNNLINNRVKGFNGLTIMPGFIASDKNGSTTTLGRGGSDYTAAIVAAAINAELLEIWTDVDGFMTADPRKVEKAYTIESLTYAEAMELSHFGAKVIYTPTLRPVYKLNIPLSVRNTFNPESRGTTIGNKQEDTSSSPIKGISSIDHIDLLTIQGPAMVGVAGTSARLFVALAKRNVSIILITQASSEHSITFAINPPDLVAAQEAIDEEFRLEIAGNQELIITVEKNLSIIAIVGEKMKNTPGISATLFRALARNGINVVATAQGSSELNISVVIRSESLRKALNAIHDGFFLSRINEVNLFIVGTGLVGTSLLKQLHKQHEMLFNERGLKVNLSGIANSRKMIIGKKAIDLERYREALKTTGEKADLGEFTKRMKSLNLRNSVFIDCTADKDVSSVYQDVLSGYVSVVTANKIACSSKYEYYNMLKKTAAERNIRFMYETTVGAGLPIIKTIGDLVLSGDRILKIEAVLSGTLNFIFNEIGPEMPLSRTIKRAREKGYSEPDPRVDLSGIDVVRKILILSREAGYQVEQEDVSVEKFLPESCFNGDLNEFYAEVEKLDEEFERKRAELVSQGRKWRFFATMDQGKASVRLITVDSSHPSYHLEGSNNIVLLTTERYRELPMVIKGYGAGADVTAAGIFADIMRVVNV